MQKCGVRVRIRIFRICLNIRSRYTPAWEWIDWQEVVMAAYIVGVYMRIYLFSYARCKIAQKWLVLWILWRTCNLADENKGFILAEIAIRAKRGTGGSKNNVTLWRYWRQDEWNDVFVKERLSVYCERKRQSVMKKSKGMLTGSPGKRRKQWLFSLSFLFCWRECLCLLGLTENLRKRKRK